LKLGWKKSWLCVSALLLNFTPNVVLAQNRAGAARRVNELTLARLHPGKDTLAQAKTLLGEKSGIASRDDNHVWTWRDPCSRQSLRIESDNRGIVQILTVSNLDEPAVLAIGCHPDLPLSVLATVWKTGKGLALGDAREKLFKLYGAPGSRSPSLRGNQELELYFYAFDWAGSDVPQVIEIYCDHATGRVVEITLAFPSL
jgi:hypothetical protein